MRLLYHGLKISLITETYGPEINGVAMTLERLVHGWQSRGHTVEIVAPVRSDRPAYVANDGLRLLLVPGAPIPRYSDLRFGFPCAGRLRRHWRKNRPDLVHIATEGPLGWSGVRAAEALNLPRVSSYHTHFHQYGSHYGYGFLRGIVSRWLRMIHNRTALTFVPSPAVLEDLIVEGVRNLRLMSRGVDSGLFDPSKRSRKLRATWQATENTRVAIYVGRLASEKNLALTLHAYSVMKEKYPDMRLVFVGDGPERKKLEAGHPEFVFAGMRKGEDLATHYASADCFIFGSETETFGNVVTEAMASGLLVLAYDYAAAGCFISDGQNGLVVPLGDRTGFLEKARQWADVADWSHLRQQAVVAVKILSWDRIVDDYLKEVEHLVENSEARQPALSANN
jgi:glycosyltransferase involved in cell wall biosynthesis